MRRAGSTVGSDRSLEQLPNYYDIIIATVWKLIALYIYLLAMRGTGTGKAPSLILTCLVDVVHLCKVIYIGEQDSRLHNWNRNK